MKGKWKPAARGTFVINEAIDLPVGQLALRAGVTSRVLGRTGTAHLPIAVPDFRSSDLRLSPIVLGVAGQVTNADAAVGLDRLRGLVPFQPTTSRSFAATDALRVFPTAGWRSSSTSLGVDVAITGGPAPRTRHLEATAKVSTPGSRQAQVDTVLSLEDLRPGSYVLSVSATTGKGKPATREIPFAIRNAK